MKLAKTLLPGRPGSACSLIAATAIALSCSLAAAADATTGSPAAGPANAAATKGAQRVYFGTPQEGAEALVAALRAEDRKALARVLGPGSARVADSGDAAADREAGLKFVADYDLKHGIQIEDDGRAFVTTGESDWPMPVPMVKSAKGWSFDAGAGERELLARRIGRNELDTIQTCLAFIDMQREYAEADRNGDGILEYAARLVSSPGKQDGLYWPSREGEPPSPAGPLLGKANAQAQPRGGARSPYHGYYYRVLTAQGRHAPDGAMNYFVKGKLIGGVALIARPAKYRNSGVQTFICSMNGLVYQKDLGPETASRAARIKTYDPDATWTKVN